MITFLIITYLAYCIPCFFMCHCNGLDWKGRLDYSKLELEDGYIHFFVNFFGQGAWFLWHDYLCVHCPWSWQRAKKYRLEDMRDFLGEKGRQHERLGLIFAKDCDERPEEIATECFVNRFSFWGGQIIPFLISPFWGTVLIVTMIVEAVVVFLYTFSKVVYKLLSSW